MANYYNDFTLSQLDVLGSGREGILFRDDFAPLDPTVRTLVIGLGGMGVKTLCRLKQTIREKLGRIDEGSLRFLAIDTDAYEREQSLSSGLLTAEEFLFLDGSGLNHAFMLPPDQQPHYLKGILPDAPLPLPMMFHGMGAGQIRLSGRLSLLEANCYGAVMKGIVTAFSKLDQNPHRRLEVWIVAGLGGGTGSGMVIDIPYLVRKVASHLGVRGNLKLKGQIYLPNVYDTGRNGIPNVGYLDAAYRNGYAALKEIDYYMTLQNSGNTFDAEYADGPYSSSENIFDRCTLIGGHDSVGDNALNPKEEAIRCCVQDLLCKITETRITDVAPTFGQWVDHPYNGVFSPFQMVLDAERSPFSWYGNYKFSFAGEASLEIPHKAVADRFLGMVFESLHGKLRQNADRVTEGAVAAFEDSVPSPSRIVQKAAADFVLKLERLLDDPDYHWTRAKLLADDRDGVLEDCMNRELNRFTREFRLEDLVSDVNAQAESVFRDIDRGPYYLERLLTAGHSDGGGVGFFRRLARYAEEVMLLRENSCDRFNKVDADREAIRAVAARQLFVLPPRYEEYKSATVALFEAKFRMHLANLLSRNVYVGLGRERGIETLIRENLTSRFLGKTDIFDRLCKIMISNGEEANRVLEYAERDPNCVLGVEDPALSSLRQTVREASFKAYQALGAGGVDGVASGLLFELTDFGERGEDWTLVPGGNGSCAWAFRDFVVGHPLLAGILHRTAKDYLDEAYGAVPSPERTAAVQAMVSYLKAYSAPGCRMWNQGDDRFREVERLMRIGLLLPECLGNLGDPLSIAGEFENAFAPSHPNLIFRKMDPNAISCVTVYAKMPLWIDRSMRDYEAIYEQGTVPGVHINENASFRFPYQDYPTLIPKEVRYVDGLTYHNPRETEIEERISALADRLLEHGLIRKGDFDSFFARIPRFIALGELPSEEASEKFAARIRGMEPPCTEEGRRAVSDAFFEAFGEEKIPLHSVWNYCSAAGKTPTWDRVKIMIRKNMQLWYLLHQTWEFYGSFFR